MQDTPKLWVVGVGASAGGLEALNALFEPARPRQDMCFVVVLHLSPDHKSMFVELLRKHTSLTVERAVGGTALAPDTIYVIEPQTTLLVEKGRLVVKPQERTHQLRLPIDALLHSLAEDQGADGIGLILSGTGSDGSRGCRGIKEKGGIVLVQRPDTASFDGMPRSVVNQGLADLALPAGEILPRLCELLDRGALGSEGVDELELTLFRKFQSAVRLTGNIDLSVYKPPTVVRRITRRAQLLGLSIQEYANRIQEDAAERSTLVQDLLIGVTRFFRDPAAFELFHEELSRYLQNFTGSTLRGWVAGCSTGEEAYTVGMVASQAIRSLRPELRLKLFATDVNPDSIERASQGRYPTSAVADIPPKILPLYFDRDGAGNFSVRPELRDCILFSRHDICRDPPFSGLDFIVCRNLLIYLKPDSQDRACQAFAFAAKRTALLLLGPSESMHDQERDFELLNTRWRLYRAASEGRRGHLRIASPGSGNSPERVREKEVELVRMPKRDQELLEIYHQLVPQFVPPHLVADSQFALVYNSGDLGGMLRIPSGRASFDVRDMLPDGVSSMLHGIFNRLSTEKDLVYKDVAVTVGGTQRTLQLRARLLEESVLERPLLILFFENVQEGTREVEEMNSPKLDSAVRDHIKDLESRLTASNEHLQATVEELETSNEELQATNEELLASNEELQSLNEELQSVNEELHTVNSEHQNKIEELTRVNADLDQLLSSIDIGTVFLDGDLRVRRFNASATDFIRLMRADVGRPLSHISHEFGDAPLLDWAAKVLRSKSALEQVLSTRTGRRVLWRCRPLADEGPLGLVMTFTDLTSVHVARESQHILKQALHRLRAPVGLLDTEGYLQLANRAFSDQFDRDPQYLEGTLCEDLVGTQDKESFREGLACVRKGESWASLALGSRADGSSFLELFELTPLKDDKGAVSRLMRVTERTLQALPTPANEVPFGFFAVWQQRPEGLVAGSRLKDLLGVETEGGIISFEALATQIHVEDRNSVLELCRPRIAEKSTPPSTVEQRVMNQLQFRVPGEEGPPALFELRVWQVAPYGSDVPTVGLMCQLSDAQAP